MKIDLETRRQATHLVFGLILAFIVLNLEDAYVGFMLLCACLILTLVLAELIRRGHEIPLFYDLVRSAGRANEQVATGVKWYFIGVTATMLLFGIGLNAKHVVVGSMLIVAIGDSISTGLGRKVGVHRLPKTRTKTFEGTFLGFAFALLGASFVVEPIVAFAGALVGMTTEAYVSPELKLNDNFAIPLLSCAAMYALSVLL